MRQTGKFALGSSASLESDLLCRRFGADAEQRVERADASDPGDNEDHADPSDGMLQSEKYVPDQQHAQHHADNTIGLADVAFEKIHCFTSLSVSVPFARAFAFSHSRWEMSEALSQAAWDSSWAFTQASWDACLASSHRT